MPPYLQVRTTPFPGWRRTAVLDRTGIWVDALSLRAIDAHEDAVKQALIWREEQRGLPARRPHQHPLFI